METFSEEELENVVLAVVRFRKSRGMTKAEIESVVNRVSDWAHQARVDISLLEMILAGHATVRVDASGELAFGLTDEGTRRAEGKA